MACSAGGVDGPTGSVNQPNAGSGAASAGSASMAGGVGSGGSNAVAGSGGDLQLTPTAGDTSQGGSVLDPSKACATETRDSKPLATDVYVLIDKSVSMFCSTADVACDKSPSNTPPPTRWSAVSDAVMMSN